MFFIYKLANTTNHKIYIGQTTKSFETRIQMHLIRSNVNNLPRSDYLHHALKKRRGKNFTGIIIDYCFDKKTLDEKEKYWIKFYNSNNRLIGYNVTDGGGGSSGHKSPKKNKTHEEYYGKERAQQINSKIRNSLLGEKSNQYKHLSEFVINDIIELYTKHNYKMKFIGSLYNLSQYKIRSVLTYNKILIRQRGGIRGADGRYIKLN